LKAGAIDDGQKMTRSKGMGKHAGLGGLVNITAPNLTIQGKYSLSYSEFKQAIKNSNAGTKKEQGQRNKIYKRQHRETLWEASQRRLGIK